MAIKVIQYENVTRVTMGQGHAGSTKRGVSQFKPVCLLHGGGDCCGRNCAPNCVSRLRFVLNRIWVVPLKWATKLRASARNAPYVSANWLEKLKRAPSSFVLNTFLPFSFKFPAAFVLQLGPSWWSNRICKLFLDRRWSVTFPRSRSNLLNAATMSSFTRLNGSGCDWQYLFLPCCFGVLPALECFFSFCFHGLSFGWCMVFVLFEVTSHLPAAYRCLTGWNCWTFRM